jgi:Zn-dependent metalloprotease
MAMCNPRDRVLCHIIPPYMLEAMLRSSNRRVREAALHNIAAAERVRSARATLAALRPRLSREIPLEVPKKKNRVVHDAKRRPDLEGPIVRREGEPARDDAEVDEAYRFSGYVYDFYQTFFKRHSIDDLGMRIKSSVRYREEPSEPYNNAFWWQQQMAYGDGDGVVFKRFTAALDVVGHELTHGIVEFTANLAYRGQPGALNEHFADVFGGLVKQWRKKQTAKDADWLVGDQLLHRSKTRAALRSMKAPGTAYGNDPDLGDDPQPSHMDQLYTGSADQGGVHINSGIPNHAFYVTAVELGGFAWEKAGAIWYDALRRLRSESGFKECAKTTCASAGTLYGAGSAEQKAVRKGWNAVGISV